jgi:hypothetical protein
MTDNQVPPIDETPNAERSPFDAFIEHQRRAVEEAGKAIEALVPPGFKEHGSEAAREFSKSFKVLADAAITELEKLNKEMEKRHQARDEGNDRPSTTGPTKVKVQVE